MIKKIIQNIVLFFLGIALILVGYSKFIKKDCVVKIGKYGILIVLTESMEPTIFPQEFILIKESDNYKLEDIVTYQNSDGLLITHRIVQIDKHCFIAKGDKNEVTDSIAPIEAIQGKVIFYSKILGIFVMQYLKIVMIAYFVIWTVICVAKQIKEKRYEEK